MAWSAGVRIADAAWPAVRSQHWRQPLRDAVEFVKRHVDSLYATMAAEVLADPHDALKQSIRLAIDPESRCHRGVFYAPRAER